MSAPWWDGLVVEFPAPRTRPLTPWEWRLGQPPPRKEEKPAPRKPSRRLPFNTLEGAQLRRLVTQAFDLRESPYLLDAVAAIVDFDELTLPDRLERRARKDVAA